MEVFYSVQLKNREGVRTFVKIRSAQLSSESNTNMWLLIVVLIFYVHFVL